MRGARAKRSSKSGLPPGTLVHLGPETARATRVTVVNYDAGNLEQRELAPGEPLPRPPASGVLWINVTGLADTARLEAIGRHFGLHALVLEDVLNTYQRPKLDDYGDYLYLVLKTFDLDEKGGRLDCDQVSLVLGRGYLLSFLEAESAGFASVMERLRSGRGQIRGAGADFLLYSLVDAVVDGYFWLLEHLGEKIEQLETEAVERARPETIRRIHGLRAEGLFIRRMLWPLREVVNSLQRGEPRLVTAGTLVFLRDVYDHTVHVLEALESLRELMAGVLEIHMSSVNNRISGVVKVLTVITTVFMPLTLIAGIYGMNFRHIPGLDTPWAFFAVLGFMATLAGGMLAWLRRKGWL
ncbi:MAG TPA: magnesium/cobalt transporter CorA [Burkholderiales bacterium]|nr:magnesium/cobalt transporter CorA [Burkholderiales bacterium]